MFDDEWASAMRGSPRWGESERSLRAAIPQRRLEGDSLLRGVILQLGCVVGQAEVLSA